MRHSATSPSISATTASSFPPNADDSLNRLWTTPGSSATYSSSTSYAPLTSYAPSTSYTPSTSYAPSAGYTSAVSAQIMGPTAAYTSAPLMGSMQVPTTYGQGMGLSGMSMPTYSQQPMQNINPAFAPPAISQDTYWMPPTTTPITPMGQGPLLSPSAMSHQSSDPRSHPNGMYTRNLIGSLCVNAFKLTDPENKLGVWFILQDLSVRTEGSFRYDIR